MRSPFATEISSAVFSRMDSSRSQASQNKGRKKDTTVAFSGVMLAQIAALPVDTDEEIPLTSTGVDADATGNAIVTTDDAGEQTLTISAQQLPVGDYEVWIGGAQRGTLTVADDGAGGTQGEIVFATVTTGTEVELDCPLAGSIEIKQLDTIFFTGSLD